MIVFVGGADHPFFDGVIVPLLPPDRPLVDEGLHSDGDERDCRVVVVTI